MRTDARVLPEAERVRSTVRPGCANFAERVCHLAGLLDDFSRGGRSAGDPQTRAEHFTVSGKVYRNYDLLTCDGGIAHHNHQRARHLHPLGYEVGGFRVGNAPNGVGTQCTYNGEPADRYVAETVPLLQNLSVVMLFMSGFCLVGYVLLCCIGGIMQYSESKKKKTAAAVEAERPPAAVTTTGDVQIRLASEEPASKQVPTATTVETNPYRTDTA